MNFLSNLKVALVGVLAVLVASCGSDENGRLVVFELDTARSDIAGVEFVVTYLGGQFAGDDGDCSVGNGVPDGTGFEFETVDGPVGQLRVRVRGGDAFPHVIRDGTAIAICRFQDESGSSETSFIPLVFDCITSSGDQCPVSDVAINVQVSALTTTTTTSSTLSTTSSTTTTIQGSF